MTQIKCSLQERWNEITNNSACHWWSDIRSHYSEPGRYYHTLHHIHRMFHLYDLLQDHLHDKEAVAFAIFFHDIIYDPRRIDNEDKSADLYLKFADSDPARHSSEVKAKIYKWIMATKNHTDHIDSGGDSDLHYFLDFDLEVLSWPNEEYKIYSDQIRKEYSFVPQMEYRTKRAQVLRKFLSQNHLYATDEFRLKCENQARLNLAREIEQLERWVS